MITFTANPYQEGFIYSSKKFPCLGAAWGTGKTLSAIARAEIYSKGIPENLGCIFRKTARSLNDSTLQDFQRYTGHKVSADRTFKYPNDSIVMFRHLDELDSINQQNINLGWFYIEQGEELDSDREFWMLIGRLRRNLKPTKEFEDLGLPTRSGWVICNAGDNWIRKGWKDQPFDGSELFEATTWDNSHNLATDFLETLRVLEKESPEIYKQFVMNSWDISGQNKVFPRSLIEHMKSRHGLLSMGQNLSNIGVVVDPSGMGADDNVFLAGNNGLPIEWFEKTIMSATEKAHHAVTMCKKHNGWWILVDCDGIGIETYQELIGFNDIFLNGIQIIKFHGSQPSDFKLNMGMNQKERPMYANMRAEAAMVAQRRGYAGLASIEPNDKKLIRQLESDTSFSNGRGLLQLIDKQEVKKLNNNESPGRGDCWKMFQWACDQGYKDQTFRTNQSQQQVYANVSEDINQLQQTARSD